MSRSFNDATTAVLHGEAPDRMVHRLRLATCALHACLHMRQDRYERMLGVAARRISSVTVVLENLADTHNCSAVLRSAEGLGLDRVHVVEQPNRFRKHHQILRGADRWIDIQRHPDIESCIGTLRDEGFTTWAADIGPGCVPLDEIDVSGPTAIIMGTEKDGLTDHAKTLADQRFTIPMYGFTGSFNVSVSATVALSRTGARRRLQLPRSGDLPEKVALERLKHWLDREGIRRGASRRRDASGLIHEVVI